MPSASDRNPASGAPPGLLDSAPPLADGFDERDPLDLQIEALMGDEDGPDLKIELNKTDPITKRHNFLKMFTWEEWQGGEGKKAVAEMYGGGEYRCRIKRKGVYAGKAFSFAIDPSVKPSIAQTGNAEIDGLKLELARLRQSVAGDQNSARGLVEMMQAQTDRTIAMQQESFKQTMALIASMMNRPAAPAPSDRLIEILAQQALRPPAPAFDIEKLMGAFTRLVPLLRGEGRSRDDEDDEGGKDGLLSAVMKLLPLAGSLIAQMNGQPPAHAPAALQAPAPSPVPRPVEQVQPVPQTVPAENAPPAPAGISPAVTGGLAQVLPMLVQASVSGEPVEAVAAQIDDGLEDNDFVQLCTLLERPDWLALLIEAHQPVEFHVQWFTALRKDLLARLKAE